MEVKSPLPGIVNAVMVKVGDEITKGDLVIAVEVMKALHKIKSSVGGKVKAIHVKVGDQIAPGQVVMEVDG